MNDFDEMETLRRMEPPPKAASDIGAETYCALFLLLFLAAYVLALYAIDGAANGSTMYPNAKMNTETK